MSISSRKIFYQRRLSPKFQEIYDLKTSNLGHWWLTLVYKYIVSHLKAMPFIYILPLSGVAAFLLYLILGQLVVKLVTLLQHGF